MRQVYLAATGMNRGKTTFALGLLAALLERGLSTGFTKPVGQRYAMVDDIPADEDAILVRTTFGLGDAYELMSPVHTPRGFTKAFIRGDVAEDLGALIETAHASLAEGRDALLIEGTGHAGVGAVIGLSNADVASRLHAPAIIVSDAGVGRPIDEIVLNAALFAQRGVPLVGALVNKADPDADPSLAGLLRRGLARHGIDLLGVLPYRPILSRATLAMILEQLHGTLLHPGDDVDRAIEHVVIGDMPPSRLPGRIATGTLLILPGDRGDLIAAAVAAPRRCRPGHSWADRALTRRGGLHGRHPAPPARPRRPAGGRHLRLPGGRPDLRGGYPGARPARQDPSRQPGQDRGDRRLVRDHFDVDGFLDRLDGLGRTTGWGLGPPVSRDPGGRR